MDTGTVEEKEEIANEEDSMEDILVSIRDIIAEENNPEGPKEEMAETMEEAMEEIKEAEAASSPEEAPANPPAEETEEEALELTDVVEEPESKEAAEEPAAAEAPKEEEATEAAEEKDVLNDIDEALGGATEDSAPSESLVSEKPAEQSTAAMKELVDNIPGPDIESKSFRGGNTVEDLVVETLKPMLSEWLDENLPTIVENIVQKEIKKLVPRD